LFRPVPPAPEVGSVNQRWKKIKKTGNFYGEFYENSYEFIWVFLIFACFVLRDISAVLVWVCVDGKSTSNLAILVFSAGSIPGWGMNWVQDQTISGFYHTSSIKRSWVWLQAEYHWLHVIPFKMCRETCYINGVFLTDGLEMMAFAFTTRSTWEAGDKSHFPPSSLYKNPWQPAKWVVFVGQRIFARLLGLGCLRCLWNRQVENRCQICSAEQWKGFCMFLVLNVSNFHPVFFSEVSIDEKEVWFIYTENAVTFWYCLFMLLLCFFKFLYFINRFN